MSHGLRRRFRGFKVNEEENVTCGGDRIDCDVPSYDRNCIDVEDKQRRGDLEWIGGNGDRYRRGSPLDSDREDGTKSIWLKDLLGQGKVHSGEEVPEWVRRELEFHWGVGCVKQSPWGWGKCYPPHQWNYLPM